MTRWILMAILAMGAVCMVSMRLNAAVSCEEKSEEGETKIKLKDCPKAVQATIKKEVGDGKIEDISKETEDGKTIYEVDAEIGGKDYEIKIAENGALISKKLEDDDDDDKKKEDKDDDDKEKKKD